MEGWVRMAWARECCQGQNLTPHHPEKKAKAWGREPRGRTLLGGSQQGGGHLGGIICWDPVTSWEHQPTQGGWQSWQQDIA